MRRTSALLAGLAGLAAPRAARAEDPRDMFGLSRKPVEQPASCGDGRAFGCAIATDPLDDDTPYALRTWLPASYALALPVADARHDAVAHWAVGAGRDDTGPFFGGATGLENRWTIEGAPSDSLRTGGADTRLPLVFLSGLTIRAGGFAARDRTSTGGTIDAELRRGTARHEIESYVWFGMTPVDARERPIATQSYQLRRLSVANGPEWSGSVVGTGPLPPFLGGRAWYAAGAAATLARTDFAWSARSLVDLDNNGDPDGLPGLIITAPIEDTTASTVDYVVPAMARVGWERGPHRVELTLVGHASRDTFFFAQATRQAGGIDRNTLTADGIATWHGSWRDTRARAQLSWHRTARDESAHKDAAAAIPQLLSAYIPAMLADDPQLATACDDARPDDPFPMVPNCPIPSGFFRSGGAGQLTDTEADRPTITADVAHRRGRHVLRAGATLEDSRLVSTSRFTGGELNGTIFEGHLDRVRFYRGTCVEEITAECEFVPASELFYRTRYTAAYAEDTFEAWPGMRVNGGLRWELMWVGPKLHLSKELAPRLGLAWDLRNDGRTRVWTSFGRSFIMLPPGLGPTILARDRTVRDTTSFFGEARTVDGGGAFGVADNIRPAAQDEFTAGIEGGLASIARGTLWVQGRTLRRGYETVLVDELTLQAEFDNPGRTGGTPASRDSVVVAAELATDPRAATVVRAGYLYGWTSGTWTGPYDPRQGTPLYGGEDWDLDTRNMDGRLPSDAGHRAFIEAQRRGKLGELELSVATRLTVSSGRPRNVLGDSDLGTIYLLPRGSAGRMPAISQVNLRLAARWRGLDAILDVFNAFDRQTATLQNEVYAGSIIRPILDGDEHDLVWLKGLNGTPAVRRSPYRLATAFQAPLSASLGIRKAF